MLSNCIKKHTFTDVYVERIYDVHRNLLNSIFYFLIRTRTYFSFQKQDLANNR